MQLFAARALRTAGSVLRFLDIFHGLRRKSRGTTSDIGQLRSGWGLVVRERIHASWRDAGFPPSRQDGFDFETNTRHTVPG
jgi:hypothetical protein